MRRVNFIIITLVIFLILSGCSTEIINPDKLKKEFYYIIVIGQSNAAGYAPIETAPNWLKGNNYQTDDYYVWNRTKNIFQSYQLGVNVGTEINNDNHFGFDIFFAKLFTEKYNEQLYCIKQTLDSTPISEKGSPATGRWTPSLQLIPENERSMIRELNIKLENANKFAENNNITLTPIAILLHQGESDASEKVRLNDYQTNFKLFISYLRNSINDSIPIINGEIYYVNSNFKEVNSILHSYSELDINFMTVNMKNHQTSIGDNLHYDASAHEYLGNQMFEYYEILKK